MKASHLPSETSRIVDECVATVRHAAGLDDAPVFPVLSSAPRREVAVFARVVAAPTEASERLPMPPRPAGSASGGRAVPRSRWALAICAFVATAATVAAIAANPEPVFQRAALAGLDAATDIVVQVADLLR